MYFVRLTSGVAYSRVSDMVNSMIEATFDSD